MQQHQFASRTGSADREIRELIDSWLDAVRRQDLAGIKSHYAPDVVAFDAIVQLQFKGIVAYGRHWEQCLGMCQEATFEVHHLETAAADDVGFCHYLARCGGTGPDGVKKMGWMRATVCVRKEGGRWLIAHEHYSAPFDIASGKALMDLEP